MIINVLKYKIPDTTNYFIVFDKSISFLPRILKILSAVLFFIVPNIYAQQLQMYIQEAEQNNPKIQAFELRYEVAKEKIEEISLPNTQFGVGYFVSKPETRTGAQEARFSVKQMLPWFGTINAREKYAGSLAETEYINIEIVKRKVTLAVSESYYKLFAITSKLSLLDENITLLEIHEQMLLKSIEVGKSSLVDVLKLQIYKNDLLERKEILEQNFLSEQGIFNAHLNRVSSSKIIVPETMIIPVANNVIELESDSIQFNPELLKYDALYESIVKSDLVNQKEGSAQIGFGVDYIPVSERTDMFIVDNGKDIIMPMVSISIPLFGKKYDSKIRQNQFRKEEIKAQKKEKENVMKVLLGKAISGRNSAIIKNNTQKNNLKQLKKVEGILLKNYETGIIDIENIIDINAAQLKSRNIQIESIQNYYIQTSIINYLTN
ncbi:TolC family protein [Aquimarina pacifica]|uniref:TolC family protein n=1 Tax=Aquimarina pacifica TaxID=1296415 RepID=UPI0009DDFFE3|nr:TolC family protein [Aquimarina pacifica]